MACLAGHLASVLPYPRNACGVVDFRGGAVAVPEPTVTGHAPFGGWRTWYRVTGDLRSGATPLAVLHGGPGAAHNYTLRMARPAEHGRAVIPYDQLRIGNSTHLPDKGADFWTVQLFLDELDNLLATLGIARAY